MLMEVAHTRLSFILFTHSHFISQQNITIFQVKKKFKLYVFNVKLFDTYICLLSTKLSCRAWNVSENPILKTILVSRSTSVSESATMSFSVVTVVEFLSDAGEIQ